MSDRAARRAITAVGLLLALTLALLVTSGREPSPSSDDVGGSAPQVVGAAPPATPTSGTRTKLARDPHGHDTPGGANERRAAREVARQFVAALLRYQRRGSVGVWLARLRGYTTAALVRRLRAQSPRPVRGVTAPRGHRRSLEVHGPVRGLIRASAVIAYRDGTRGLLDLELRRQSGRWRVSALYR